MRKTLVQVAATKQLDAGQQVSLIGSCFAQHFAEKLRQVGHFVNENPFGVVFNPLSLADVIVTSLETDKQQDLKITQRDDLFFSWKANSTCYEFSDVKLKTQLVNSLNAFRTDVLKSKWLFVTFGTAWVYRLKSNNELVANCHKFPNKDFQKELLSVENVVSTWQKTIDKLRQLNPELTIVFTLSPVRHLKDGLVENALSKAILLQAIHSLLSHNSGSCKYFPAYEIAIDELRDYAYYLSDGLHLNAIGVDYIWERFKATQYTDDALTIVKSVEQLLSQFRHRSLHPNSKEDKKFIASRENQLALLKSLYPNLNYEIFSSFENN